MQLDVVGFGESRMDDGCVEIVHGFDTKDGCVVGVCQARDRPSGGFGRLECDWKTIEAWL